MWPLPMMHWTSLYRALATSDIWWPSMETCSNSFTSGTTPHQCWHLVAVEARMVDTSRQYTFYWNAFLQLRIQRPVRGDQETWNLSFLWLIFTGYPYCLVLSQIFGNKYKWINFKLITKSRRVGKNIFVLKSHKFTELSFDSGQIQNDYPL